MVTLILYPSEAVRVQAVESEKYVELLCDVALAGFLPPLAYNVLLIVACCVYGFMCRKFPANFNEAYFIFLLTTMTTFTWLVREVK